MSEYTHKIVNGEEVELTAQEIAELEAQAAAAQVAAEQQAIRDQLRALEALLTPRLVCEALAGETCIVNKPGCCIDGLTPAQAAEAINIQAKALRAQLTSPPLYQNPGE